MTGKVTRILIVLFLLIKPGTQTPAQMLDDSITYELIKTGVDYIYNFQFESAKKIYYD